MFYCFLSSIRCTFYILILLPSFAKVFYYKKGCGTRFPTHRIVGNVAYFGGVGNLPTQLTTPLDHLQPLA